MQGVSNYYSALVVKDRPYMSNWMDDTNHLRTFLGDIQPQKMDNMINTLFTSRQDMSTAFLSDLESKAATTMMLTGTSDAWSWKFKKPMVPAQTVENMEIGNATPGVNKGAFKLKLDRDWFTYGDVISPDRFSGKAVRVVPDGIYPESGGVVYIVQLVTDSKTDFFPAMYLDEGVQYEYLYSIYGEYNDQGTKVIHGGEIELVNALAGELRTETAITDWADALTITVSSVIVSDKGEPLEVKDSRWFKRSEMAAWSKHRRQKENYLVFGAPGSNLQGPSAYDVKSGMGMWHMMHLGNVEYYNTLTMTRLEESIGAMYYGRVPMEQRSVVLYTGEAGFILFSRAVELKLNGLGGLIPLDKFITGSGMSMGFGYQFRSYQMPNGGTITLKHMKLLDSYTTKHERGAGRFSKMSATFIGLDMSHDASENVKIVKRSTRPDDYWGYVAGTASPYGPVKGGLTSNKRAGYEMWIQSRIGLHIEDITKTFMLKPTFEF
jgi:hypothetical protein